MSGGPAFLVASLTACDTHIFIMIAIMVTGGIGDNMRTIKKAELSSIAKNVIHPNLSLSLSLGSLSVHSATGAPQHPAHDGRDAVAPRESAL